MYQFPFDSMPRRDASSVRAKCNYLIAFRLIPLKFYLFRKICKVNTMWMEIFMHGSVKGITTKQKSNNISFVPHLHCLMSRFWFIIIANYKFAKRRKIKLWCGVISYKFYGCNLPTLLWKISEWSEFLEEFNGLLKCKLFHCCKKNYNWLNALLI